MTPAERLLWQRINRRAAGLRPDLAAAILRSFELIRAQLSTAELERLVTGSPEVLLAALLNPAVVDAAFLPVRERIMRTVEQGVRYTVPSLPKGGTINGITAVAFDVLSPHVLDALDRLNTKVIQTLATNVRETVRAHIENGIRDGVNPRETARALREVIGLAPQQAEAVRNYERMLRGGPRVAVHQGATESVLRDKRFDRTLAKARSTGTKLTDAQVERMTGAYRRRMLAFNAETNARTATLDSFRAGNRLAWETAAEKGIVDRGRLFKTWLGVLDDRERPEHVAMEGQTVPFDQAYSNDEMTPGDSTYNCRCVERYSQA